MRLMDSNEEIISNIFAAFISRDHWLSADTTLNREHINTVKFDTSVINISIHGESIGWAFYSRKRFMSDEIIRLDRFLRVCPEIRIQMFFLLPHFSISNNSSNKKREVFKYRFLA
jgi:hypothetical protein